MRVLVTGGAGFIGSHLCAQLGARGDEVRVLDDKRRILGADCVVAEKNFGGDMVESTIKAVDSAIPVKMVTASRGKEVRAEPVSALYGADDRQTESGLVVPGSVVLGTPGLGSEVHHVGHFPELETEMTTWVAGSRWSPNRLDALVWVLTELLLVGRGRVDEVGAEVF